MSQADRQVADVNGVRYTLRRRLGRGGQGAVYEVEGGRLAVKVLCDASPARRERLRNQLTQVRRLSLDGLEIARPLEMLREPSLGYVMELLTGMQPLATLARVPRGTASPASWYSSGGGLRRRLRLLARAADCLSALHGKGLAYADPSPNNLFVSESLDAAEVRLIDADNLHYASVPGGPAVFTPGFGAPELVQGRAGVSTLTDAHAFAVLAFQALTLAHPLLGDAVEEAPPEREEQALAGLLPWIDHPTDDRNRSTRGIPRGWVLSRRLQEVAGLTFGPGLRAATSRPGVSTWAERLHAAADATVRCSACASTYYFTAERCPWCDTPRPAFATASFGLWDPTLGSGRELLQRPDPSGSRHVIMGVLVLADGETVVVPRRLAFGEDGRAGHMPVVSLSLAGGRLTVQSLDGAPHRLTSPTGGRSAEASEVGAPLRLEAGVEAWRLHFGPPDRLHRVIRFELRPGRTG